jgi:hopanoid biosynthesis associated RND transporter like protein HpnN
MRDPSSSLTVRALLWLADTVYRWRRVVVVPHLILFGLSVWYTVEHLQFTTDRSDLLDSRQKYHQMMIAYRDEFRAQDDLVTIVESDEPERNRQFVERLAPKLEAQTNLFTDIFYKGDLKLMGPKALLFLPEDTLQELDETLRDYRPFIHSVAQATNLNDLFRIINQRFRTASREPNAANESLLKALPAIQRIVEQASDALDRPGMPPSPGVNALFGAGREAERQQYLTFADGRMYLITARAVSDDVTGAAVRRLRELLAQTQVEVPGVNVGLTGEPVLEVDEMRQSQRDTLQATVVSLALVALIFIYGYQETGRPLKATLCLVVGLGYTMGFTTLVIGHLNILTITFAPMLIGLGIDFGVHLITRYEEELRHGRTEEQALRRAMVNTGQGIFTGALTTAGAFLAMGVTEFRGIREMGIISGGGVILCLVPMMTLLPALLLRGRQNILDHALAQHPAAPERLERFWLSRPRRVLFVAAVVTALSIHASRRNYFDYNLLNMQSPNLPAVVFQHKLINGAGKSLLYAAFITDSLPEVVALQNRLTNLSTVATVESMGRLLTEDQAAKLEVIGRIKQELQPLQFAETDRGPVRLAELNQTLEILRAYLALAIEEVRQTGERDLLQQMTALRDAISRLKNKLNGSDPALPVARLAAFQQALMDDIRATFEALRTQDDSGRLRPEDLPPALQRRFVGRSGKHLLQVYPRENIWEREPQRRFVEELRSVSPDVTGTPVQLLEYTTLLKDSYVEAAWYALVAIVVLVMFHFRSVVCVGLALLPVFLGMLWMSGLMVLLGIPFNPANIMTLPLIIGVGVTNGIHILNRYAEERSPAILSKSTGKAVIVSGLTTIAGFGSLILAEHRGIESLGYVMSTGTACCMIAALTVLPATLNLIGRHSWTMKEKTQWR